MNSPPSRRPRRRASTPGRRPAGAQPARRVRLEPSVRAGAAAADAFVAAMQSGGLLHESRPACCAAGCATPACTAAVRALRVPDHGRGRGVLRSGHVRFADLVWPNCCASSRESQGARILDVGCGARARRAGRRAGLRPAGPSWCWPTSTRRPCLRAPMQPWPGMAHARSPGRPVRAVQGEFDLIVANPPYLNDAAGRTYRTAAASLGEGLGERIVARRHRAAAPGRAAGAVHRRRHRRRGRPAARSLWPTLDRAAGRWRLPRAGPRRVRRGTAGAGLCRAPSASPRLRWWCRGQHEDPGHRRVRTTSPRCTTASCAAATPCACSSRIRRTATSRAACSISSPDWERELGWVREAGADGSCCSNRP
jgi:hypothetical protein